MNQPEPTPSLVSNAWSTNRETADVADAWSALRYRGAVVVVCRPSRGSARHRRLRQVFETTPFRRGSLDRYLMRDGLDTATLTGDIEVFTRDPVRFGWNVPEYEEFTEHMHPPPGQAPPSTGSYLTMLCERLARTGCTPRERRAAKPQGQLWKASAELRQAIANTQLQRVVLTFSAAAVIVAVVSLLNH